MKRKNDNSRNCFGGLARLTVVSVTTGLLALVSACGEPPSEEESAPVTSALTLAELQKGQVYGGWKIADRWAGTTLRNAALNYSNKSSVVLTASEPVTY